MRFDGAWPDLQFIFIFPLVICTARCNVIAEYVVNDKKRSRRQFFKIRDAVDIQSCLNCWAACGAAEVELTRVFGSHVVGVPLHLPTSVPSTSQGCMCTIGSVLVLGPPSQIYLSIFKFQFQ